MDMAIAIWLMLYGPTPKPQFHIIPAPGILAPAVNTGNPGETTFVGASVSGSINSAPPGRTTIEQQPTPPECQSYTGCLSQQYGGLSNNGGQDGYIAVCPDGTPAQGSCSDPGGEK